MSRATDAVLHSLLGLLVLLAGGSAAGPVATAHAVPTQVPSQQPAASAAVRYAAPVPLDVVRGFEAPPSPYAAGHRGVDLASTPGEVVHAAAGGTVTFAGSVAGRGVIVITHADGVSTEYEPVAATVSKGASVSGGTTIGTVVGVHGDCPLSGCLHWGAKHGNNYFDPLSLLYPLGPVRLLPWAG